jgi:hypothetical protein
MTSPLTPAKEMEERTRAAEACAAAGAERAARDVAFIIELAGEAADECGRSVSFDYERDDYPLGDVFEALGALGYKVEHRRGPPPLMDDESLDHLIVSWGPP